ncbi:MAG: hypothetical protein HRT36_07660 [Alphaproteobacteria bacterium]|nr:hypothetical protein [Alphaproteobacteria bacterium]
MDAERQATGLIDKTLFWNKSQPILPLAGNFGRGLLNGQYPLDARGVGRGKSMLLPCVMLSAALSMS